MKRIINEKKPRYLIREIRRFICPSCGTEWESDEYKSRLLTHNEVQDSCPSCNEIVELKVY